MPATNGPRRVARACGAKARRARVRRATPRRLARALTFVSFATHAQRFVAGAGELSVRTAPLAGFLTGYLESACVTPFELVKARRGARPLLPVVAF